MIIIQNKLKNAQEGAKDPVLNIDNNATEQETLSALKDAFLDTIPQETSEGNIDHQRHFPPVEDTGGNGIEANINSFDENTTAQIDDNVFHKQEEIQNETLEQNNFQDIEKLVDSAIDQNVSNSYNPSPLNDNGNGNRNGNGRFSLGDGDGDGWMHTNDFLDMFQDAINTSNHKELKAGKNIYPLLISNIKIRLMVQMKKEPNSESILFRFPSDREILSGISTGMYLSEVAFEMKVVPKQQILSMKNGG